jgi:hypothetical protein
MVIIQYQNEVLWNGTDFIDQQGSHFHPAALGRLQVIQDRLTETRLDLLKSAAEITKETDIIVILRTQG